VKTSSDHKPTRCAIVTGGGRGIGFAVAQRLARAGMSVGVCDIRDELVRSACDELASAGFVAEGTVCDVRDEGEVRRMIERQTDTLPSGQPTGTADLAEPLTDPTRAS